MKAVKPGTAGRQIQQSETLPALGLLRVSAPCSCLLCLYCWELPRQSSEFLFAQTCDLLFTPWGWEPPPPFWRRDFTTKETCTYLYIPRCWCSCLQMELLRYMSLMTESFSVRTVIQIRTDQTEELILPKAPWTSECSPAHFQFILFVTYLLTPWSNIHKKLLYTVLAVIATANNCLI